MRAAPRASRARKPEPRPGVARGTFPAREPAAGELFNPTTAGSRARRCAPPSSAGVDLEADGHHLRLGRHRLRAAVRRAPARQGGREALRRQLVRMGRRSRHAQGDGRGVSGRAAARHEARPGGRRRKEWTGGIVNPPVWRASTILFDSVAEMRAANPPEDGTLHYGRNGTPTPMGARRGADRAGAGRGGTRLFPSGVAAVDGAADGAEARRRAADGRQRLRPDAALLRRLLKRYGITTRYYDPLIGARHRGADRRATRAIFLESPGSLTFEVQDVPGICAVGEGAGARHPARQYLGDAAAVPGAGRGRRSRDPRLHQICRRPFRRDAGLGHRDGGAWRRSSARAAPGPACQPDDAWLARGAADAGRAAAPA
jgi:hypothetical protein